MQKKQITREQYLLLSDSDKLKYKEFYFDERFIIGCYEDNDYCKRVEDLGGKVYVNKEVKIRHLLSQTISKLDYDGVMKENKIKFKEKYWR
jgi:GT2 family glycosyltransferase